MNTLEGKVIKSVRIDEHGMTLSVSNRSMQFESEKLREVIYYCYPHTEHMWAARIIGTLLDCDFRDASAKAKEFLGL